jgi:hypothetical protein
MKVPDIAALIRATCSAVIARSDSDEAIYTAFAARWIASLRSQ